VAVLLCWLAIPVGVFAQSTYQLGILPAVNFNKQLKKDWSFNARIESRQLFLRGEKRGLAEKDYNYVLTDVSVIAAKKVGLNSRIAGGYLIRFEEGDLFHRFIQQYTLVQKLSGFRLAHRLVSDQTISKIESPEIRFRYRITAEIPLNGQSLDVKEFYLKLNHEYLNSFQASQYDFEVRLVPLLGYDIARHFKIETGIDYRVNGFLNNRTRHSYWFPINLFIDF
jgi:hypothetical protein